MHDSLSLTFYICGAGGFGRETLDAVRATSPSAETDVIFLDEYPPVAGSAACPVVRPVQAGPGKFVVAIADPTARERLAATLVGRGLTPGQVVDPRAVVSAAAPPGRAA